MGILSVITGVFKPVADLIDNLHTSEEERLKIKQQMFDAQTQLYMQALESETQQVEAKAVIIKAEAEGQSWMQRNWRPSMMYVFILIILWNYLIAPIAKQPILELPPGMWDLMYIAMGGYVAGRTIEKVLPGAMETIVNKITSNKGKEK
mgnify:CR=1 FL=1